MSVSEMQPLCYSRAPCCVCRFRAGGDPQMGLGWRSVVICNFRVGMKPCLPGNLHGRPGGVLNRPETEFPPDLKVSDTLQPARPTSVRSLKQLRVVPDCSRFLDSPEQ